MYITLCTFLVDLQLATSSDIGRLPIHTTKVKTNLVYTSIKVNYIKTSLPPSPDSVHAGILSNSYIGTSGKNMHVWEKG